MTDELDKIKSGQPVKDYSLKTLKAKSNPLVAKALAVMEEFMDDPSVSIKDKAAMGMNIVKTHIVILDKEEKADFQKIHKQNAVLKNNQLIRQELEAEHGEGYKKLTDLEDDESASKFDLGWEFLEQGDKAPH